MHFFDDRARALTVWNGQKSRLLSPAGRSKLFCLLG
jgi:hypothetical protein